MQSLEAEAIRVLFTFTARSVMSPLKESYKYQSNKSKRKKKKRGREREGQKGNYLRLTSCPRQLAKQYAVSIDQILTRRSSEPVITYLPDRSKMAARDKIFEIGILYHCSQLYCMLMYNET